MTDIDQDHDQDFAIDLFEQVLQKMEAVEVTQQQKNVLQQVIPVLFEGLPELLRAVRRQNMQKSGQLQCTKPIDEIDDIEPLRFLGQFLFRHNPNFDNVDPPALRHKLKQYAEERGIAPSSSDEKIDDDEERKR
jgi:hypothetical protein